MEVMQRPVEVEVVAEQPPTWRPDDAPRGDLTRSSSSSDGYKNEQEVLEKNDISENSVFLDKVEGSISQWTITGKNLSAEDLDIVNAVLNSQNGEEVINDEIETGTSTPTLRLKSEVVEESDDDEVIELEFERAAEKAHTHTAHCPNCSSQITKVVLRRRKWDKKVPSRPEKPVHLFGCLSCFSIFIPSGDCLNPFRIFGAKGKQESKLHAAAGGSTNVDESTTIKQGSVFGLFSIFRKKRENETTQDSQGNDKVKYKGKCIREEENSLDNSTGVVKDDNNASNETDLSHKPGHYSGNTSSTFVLFEERGVAIADGKGGVNEEVTDVGKTGSEIGEEQHPKYQSPRGPQEESSGQTIIEVGEDTDLDALKQPLILGTNGSKSLEIVKCIVYGGLVESIASLSVVSSAAASDVSTLKITALGLASVIGSLFVFGQNLMDLRSSSYGGNSNQQPDKYQELLGRRGHFLLHATFAVFSFLVFGLLPPVIYGFSFRESDNKDYKILAVAAASITCVFILAIAQAYARSRKKVSEYVKTILYYVTMAISVSGVSYAAGDVITMLMEKFGWFEPSPATPAWASY